MCEVDLDMDIVSPEGVIQLEELAKENPIFRRAVDALYEISADPETWKLLAERELARKNEKEAREYLDQYFLALGRVEGKKEAQHQIVRAMIAANMTNETISSLTKMPSNDIETIRRS